MRKLIAALLVAGLIGAVALAGCFSGGGAKGEGCEVTKIVLVHTDVMSYVLSGMLCIVAANGLTYYFYAVISLTAVYGT